MATLGHARGPSPAESRMVPGSGDAHALAALHGSGKWAARKGKSSHVNPGRSRRVEVAQVAALMPTGFEAPAPAPAHLRRSGHNSTNGHIGDGHDLPATRQGTYHRRIRR